MTEGLGRSLTWGVISSSSWTYGYELPGLSLTNEPLPIYEPGL